MLHSAVLKRLFPAEILGVFSPDTEVEGAHLDAVQADAETILLEACPDKAMQLLAAWERVCGLAPLADEPLQARRDAVLRKLRERGGLSRAYFILLAATMGYTITIEELQAFRAGVNRCGDPLWIYDVLWIWRVHISGTPVYHFRTGQSAAGERLLWWTSASALEAVLTELKPAHTYIIFDYS